ncbi:MAG: 3-oxoacyl-ACP reductase FabG [Crocinitomicaceae bacterium]|nr:3-oxoacyl-ACP reductase FabG [Crocinitomicaceae bacterium]
MKYALVTGGSRGIGKAVCLELAEMGYNVLINYAGNHEAATATKEQVEALGQKAATLQFDVADRNAVRTALESWKENNPEATIEVLVNNAGIRKDNLMMWMKDEEWDQVLDISLGGFYNVTKEIVQDMIKAKKGKIVNIVSLSGLKGLPGQTNYSAAKAAVIGATKALAQEVARRNITVNAVAPGFIKTDMTGDLNEKEFLSHIPMRRFGEVEEVAKVVGFLSSPASSYITGEVISINGGIY